MVAAVPGFTVAQDDPPFVLVINFDQALNDSDAGRAIRERTAELQASLREELETRGAELDAEDRALAAQRSELDAVDFEERARDFEERLAEFQQYETVRTKEINDAFKAAFAKLDGEARTISADLLDEFGATLAVTHLVVIAHKSMDATEALVAAMNERIPEVPLEFDTNSPDAAGDELDATEAEAATDEGVSSPEAPVEEDTSSTGQ